MVDAFYAGTLGAMNFATLDVDATVDLPCEEVDYENGVSDPLPTLSYNRLVLKRQCHIAGPK